MIKEFLKAHLLFTLSILFFMGLFFTPAYAGQMEGPLVDAVSYYNQAVDAASQGSDQMAMDFLDKALSLQPDFYLAQITKAGLLSKNGNNSEAMQLLEDVNKTHPDNKYYLATMTSVFINTGQFEKAITSADAALLKDPTLIEVWILKGTAHGALGEFEEEIIASEQALKIDPENINAISNLNYAREMITVKQNKTHQGGVETTPISVFFVLTGVLVSFLLFRLRD
ncbi:hypothetical protein DLD82_05535 [Methanospirillum stamsii]|uniref:Uncharacterized protein n=2 Tax=Methanospirillum stamsii TaxID=1277351 RepID=A0A2V2N963_9EURY|nr:hypothetical protein DLD82_05535 [Methanospirillum stamsii]